ncbi:hypothetical protein LB505_009699 [Fusarium chuoi]|nr:hypothetical protein LB505_009699 [Fusarium chuoi]
MSGLAHNGLPFGTLSRGNRSQSMDGSDAPPDRTSPASNALEDSTTDEFGLASRSRADATDLGGKPKEDKADATPAWNESREGKKTPPARVHCMSPKEDPLLRRETRLQALFTLSYTMCV